MRSEALSRGLSLDLEVGRHDKLIHAFAGVRLDTGRAFAYSGAPGGLSSALDKLDELAEV